MTFRRKVESVWQLLLFCFFVYISVGIQAQVMLTEVDVVAWTTEVEALEFIRRVFYELFNVALFFDTFHTNLHSKLVSHLRDMLDDFAVAFIAGRSFLNECIIKFESACFEILQIAKI